MTTDQTIAPFAAAVYNPDTADRMALYKFVEKQKALNTRIGGVLQEGLFDAQGTMTGLNAIDVSTDRRIPISRPVPNDDDCGLDVAALALPRPSWLSLYGHAELHRTWAAWPRG